MKFYLHNARTCTRLRLVGEELSELLIKNNWLKVDQQDSEIIFVNSCSFLEEKETEFLSLITDIYQSKADGQRVAVFGCLPSVCKSKIDSISPEIIQFGRDLKKIAAYFKLEMKDLSVNFANNDRLTLRERLILIANSILTRDEGIKYRLQRDQIYHLKISDGCRGRCAYCSEKFTTAHKSRKISEVVSSFEKGLRAGYKLFALNSDDTSVFGLDNGESIFELSQQLLSYEGDYKIAISEFNPQGLFDKRLLKVLSNGKIIYITIPIQSGSQKILDEMRRPYKIDNVVERVKELKRKNPTLKTNTHIIVGFPGESREDFQLTLNIMRQNIFDRVKIFEYSDRPMTEASNMVGKVPQKEILSRANKVKRIVLWRNFLSFSISNLLLNSKTMN